MVIIKSLLLPNFSPSSRHHTTREKSMDLIIEHVKQQFIIISKEISSTWLQHFVPIFFRSLTAWRTALFRMRHALSGFQKFYWKFKFCKFNNPFTHCLTDLLFKKSIKRCQHCTNVRTSKCFKIWLIWFNLNGKPLFC